MTPSLRPDEAMSDYAWQKLVYATKINSLTATKGLYYLIGYKTEWEIYVCLFLHSSLVRVCVLST